MAAVESSTICGCTAVLPSLNASVCQRCNTSVAKPWAPPALVGHIETQSAGCTTALFCGIVCLTLYEQSTQQVIKPARACCSTPK